MKRRSRFGEITGHDDAKYALDVEKNILLKAGESITLQVGASVLVMKQDGTVTLNGKTIDVVGSSHIGLESERIDLN